MNGAEAKSISDARWLRANMVRPQMAQCGTPSPLTTICSGCFISQVISQDDCGILYPLKPVQPDANCLGTCGGCGTPKYAFTQCVACNQSQDISQDDCGAYFFDPIVANSNCGNLCTQPAPNCGQPALKYNQCVGCNESQQVYQDDCGNYSTGSVQHDPACANVCLGTVPPTSVPPPVSNCGQPQVLYNQCVGCNQSQPVYQDSCGNYSTGNPQNDGACSKSCTGGVTPPKPPPPGPIPAPTQLPKPVPTPTPNPTTTPQDNTLLIAAGGLASLGLISIAIFYKPPATKAS